MKFQINPLSARCDQKLTLLVSEVPPQSVVRLSAALTFPWDSDLRLESSACFRADENGQVNPDGLCPISGSYAYIDSMGLIESLHSPDPQALTKMIQNIALDQPLHITFTAHLETTGFQESLSVCVERNFYTPEIQRQPLQGEIVGDWFYAEDPRRPIVLFLGGSGSNRMINAPIGAALASRGFNVLALAYFGEKGLPPQLSAIPLEYFEKAFAWLDQNPLTHGQPLNVLGISKGAELALLLASRYPQMTRVVAMAPHAYCFQGIAFKNVSSWTDHGQSLPYIRLKNRWLLADLLGCFLHNRPFGYTHTYRKGLAAAHNLSAARIPIENAHADLLLFTSRENNMWNTADGCAEIIQTLQTHRYPHTYEQIIYPDTGEPYYVPYLFPASQMSARIAPRLTLSMGGTLAGNAHAKADAWERAIAFLKQSTPE